jgi:hypothetical protein
MESSHGPAVQIRISGDKPGGRATVDVKGDRSELANLLAAALKQSDFFDILTAAIAIDTRPLVSKVRPDQVMLAVGILRKALVGQSPRVPGPRSTRLPER